jgi:tRNA(Ile)-lysidine synthetase-like protein
MIKPILQLLPEKHVPMYVAVSMGTDSVAIYHWLKSRNYKVTPIHFNHKLRPQNDIMQQKFCSAFPYGLYGVSETNCKTENDCREERFKFFRKLTTRGEWSSLNDDPPKFIVTGHHLDDYVENYLLNCFRGQPQYKPMSLLTKFPTFTVLHPFLLTEKKDFIEFLVRNRLVEFTVEDETNTEIKGSRRNWIRNTIIPELTSQSISLKKYCKRRIDDDILELQSEF